MTNRIDLTEAERIAKDFFILLMVEGSKSPCTIPSEEVILPSWYNPMKFQRGQKYFNDNRLGFLFSNFTSILTLLAEPKGLQTLIATGKSYTPDLSRKRYLSTLAYTLTWYDDKLVPGSKSFELLKKVRRMHYYASHGVHNKGVGYLNQTEITTTVFGFMGYGILRPDLLGIRHEKREDREALIHFWAVICYFLGIEDRFNMCLLPLDAFYVLCQIAVRYALLPLSQIETADFKKMALALVDAFKLSIPTINYESQMFQIRHLLSVPGYQYKLDVSKEVLCRSILTQKELNYCKKSYEESLGMAPYFNYRIFAEDVPLIEVLKFPFENCWSEKDNVIKFQQDVVINDRFNVISETYLYGLRKSLELDSTQSIVIRFIRYEDEWFKFLNDSKFHKMNKRSQVLWNANKMIIELYKLIAKKHFLLLLKEAQKIPCDFSIPAKIDEGLQSWYNEELYERAKKFYRKNRPGILYSNVIGLICLFAEPQAVQVIKLTGRSSNPEVAKKRYLDTVIHILTWYNSELSSGSKIIDSLKKLRKYHYLSSKSAEKKEIGFISQAELVLTIVGLMGFILTRTKLLKIQSDDDDMKALSHFWRVICYMPNFVELTNTMLASVNSCMPLVNYEVELFCTRMLCMVPGYQHNVDYSQEFLCRSIITSDDVNEIKESLTGVQYYSNRIKSYLSVDVPIIKIVKGQYVNGISQRITTDKEDGDPELIEFVREVMKLGPLDHVSVKYIDYEKNWRHCLNDSNYNELSIRARLNLMFRYLQLAIYNTSIGRRIWNYVIEKLLQRIKSS